MLFWKKPPKATKPARPAKGSPIPTISGVPIPRPIWNQVVDQLIPGTDSPEDIRAGRTRSARLKRGYKLDKDIRRQVRELAIELMTADLDTDQEPDWVARLESVEAPTTPIKPEIAPQQKAGTSAPSTDQHESISPPSAGSQNSTLQTNVLTDGQKQAFSGQPGQPVQPGPRPPVITNRPCICCHVRLAFWDGTVCQPCAEASQAPPHHDPDHPAAIVSAPGRPVDIADLFPLVGEPLGGGKGPTTLEIWRQQDRQERDRRDYLLSILRSRQEPIF